MLRFSLTVEITLYMCICFCVTRPTRRTINMSNNRNCSSSRCIIITRCSMYAYAEGCKQLVSLYITLRRSTLLAVLQVSYFSKGQPFWECDVNTVPTHQPVVVIIERNEDAEDESRRTHVCRPFKNKHDFLGPKRCTISANIKNRRSLTRG